MPPVTLMQTPELNTTVSYDYRFQPWVVCFAASLFFFFAFMQMNMFNALDPALMKAFQLNATELGRLSAYYFYANVLFLFPAGMILDRISTRKVIVIAMLTTVLATLGFALSTAAWQAALCRFITGIGGSVCLLSSVRLASRWFPPKRMALVVGLIVTFAMIGGTVAQTPFTLLTDHLGWRSTMLIDSLSGFFMLLVIIFFVKDYPPGKRADYHAEQKALQGAGFWHSLWRTIKNLQNWFAGLYTSFMNLPLILLGALWGGLYLVQVRGLTRADASVVTSMLFIGTIIGSPVVGWLSDRLRRRRSPMIVGALVSLALVGFLIFIPKLSFLSLAALFLGLGFVTSTQIISYPLIAESNPLTLTGTAEGLASTLIMAGGFTQPLFAWLMEWHWAPQYVNQIPLFSASNYQLALGIMPVAFILSLVMALLIRETRCVAYRE